MSETEYSSDCEEPETDGVQNQQGDPTLYPPSPEYFSNPESVCSSTTEVTERSVDIEEVIGGKQWLQVSMHSCYY